MSEWRLIQYGTPYDPEGQQMLMSIQLWHGERRPTRAQIIAAKRHAEKLQAVERFDMVPILFNQIRDASDDDCSVAATSDRVGAEICWRTVVRYPVREAEVQTESIA